MVPDGAEFVFGDENATNAGNLWPISKTSNETPTKSYAIIPQSAFNTGTPVGHWTSSTRLGVQWSTAPLVGASIVRGVVQTYSPAIPGADLSGWTTGDSGAVFDLGPAMLDEFGFGSRYKRVELADLENPFEYVIESSTSILVFVDEETDIKRLAYAKENLQVYANWIQGKIRSTTSSTTCLISGRLLGGTPFRGTFGSTTTLTFDITVYGSVFAYSAYNANGFKFDGTNSLAARCTAVECTAAQNGYDGFGYYGGIGALEVNCFATWNGAVYPTKYIGEEFSSTDNQGFTTHGDCTVLRVACWSFRSRGPNYQDTNFGGTTYGTRIIMLGCYGGESTARVGGRFPCDILVGQDDASDPNTWVWLVSFKYESPAGIPSRYTANLRSKGIVLPSTPYGARIYTTDGSVPSPIVTDYPSNTTVIGISL